MEDEATLRSEIQANRETTHVVCHKCLWTACQNSVHLKTSFFPSRHPINLVTVHWRFQPSPNWLCHHLLSIFNHHLSYTCDRSCLYLDHQPMNIELLACICLTVTSIGPLPQTATDQMGWRGQLKMIKTKPDGPGQMGLTDLYPWAKEKTSPSFV